MEDQLDIKEIETTGVHLDEDGTSAVPADNVEDLSDFTDANPLKLPDFGPEWHCQWIRIGEWPLYKNLGFVAITTAEVGLNASESDLVQEYGRPSSTIYAFGDSMAIRCPKKLYLKVQKSRELDRRAALPPEHDEPRTIDDGARGRIVESATFSRKTTFQPRPSRKRE